MIIRLKTQKYTYVYTPERDTTTHHHPRHQDSAGTGPRGTRYRPASLRDAVFLLPLRWRWDWLLLARVCGFVPAVCGFVVRILLIDTAAGTAAPLVPPDTGREHTVPPRANARQSHSHGLCVPPPPPQKGPPPSPTHPPPGNK